MKHFRKVLVSKDYTLIFDSELALEILEGNNGKPDPFYLHLPSAIDVGIMGHCINSCHICYQGHIKEANMKLDDFKLIIDQTHTHTNQVALGGRGDPNLHENFKEILEYARNNNVVPNYTTSGNGLTDEQIEISKLCGAVAVSDYGQPYTYDAIKRFMDAGIKTNIHIIFNKFNYEKCIKLLSGFDPWEPTHSKVKKETDVDINRINAIIFLLYKAVGEAKDKPELFPTKYQMNTFIDRVLNSECKFKVGIDSCLTNHIIKSGVDLSEEFFMTTDSCEAARMVAYISPSLQLVPCSFADNDVYGVKIKKKSIQNIWNKSKKFKSFRSMLRKKPCDCPLGV